VESISVREAVLEDSESLFAWRNDPQTRAASLNTGQVEWDDHVQWFSNALSSPKRIILIAIDDLGKRIGMCRFDIEAETVEVSINLNPESRGKRLASPILHHSIEALIQSKPGTQKLIARIRPDNPGSIRIFELNGFSCEKSSNEVNVYSRSTGV
jgi:RimJ/RimL family protein N-acetyltransferase